MAPSFPLISISFVILCLVETTMPEIIWHDHCEDTGDWNCVEVKPGGCTFATSCAHSSSNCHQVTGKAVFIERPTSVTPNAELSLQFYVDTNSQHTKTRCLVYYKYANHMMYDQRNDWNLLWKCGATQGDCHNATISQDIPSSSGYSVLWIALEIGSARSDDFCQYDEVILDSIPPPSAAPTAHPSISPTIINITLSINGSISTQQVVESVTTSLTSYLIAESVPSPLEFDVITRSNSVILVVAVSHHLDYDLINSNDLQQQLSDDLNSEYDGNVKVNGVRVGNDNKEDDEPDKDSSDSLHVIVFASTSVAAIVIMSCCGYLIFYYYKKKNEKINEECVVKQAQNGNIYNVEEIKNGLIKMTRGEGQQIVLETQYVAQCVQCGDKTQEQMIEVNGVLICYTCKKLDSGDVDKEVDDMFKPNQNTQGATATNSLL